MNGEYQLKLDEGAKPDPNCVDGCVYTRQGNSDEEYCFARSDQAGGDHVKIVKYLKQLSRRVCPPKFLSCIVQLINKRVGNNSKDN